MCNPCYFFIIQFSNGDIQITTHYLLANGFPLISVAVYTSINNYKIVVLEIDIICYVGIKVPKNGRGNKTPLRSCP